MLPKFFRNIVTAAKGAIQQVIPGGKTYADVQREEEEKRRRAEEAARQRQAEQQARAAQQQRIKVQNAPQQQERIKIAQPQAQPNVKVVPASPRLQLKIDQQKQSTNIPLKNSPANPVDKRSNIAKAWDFIKPGDDKSWKVSENRPPQQVEQERIQLIDKKKQENQAARDELRKVIKDTRGDWGVDSSFAEQGDAATEALRERAEKIKRVQERQRVADQIMSPGYSKAPLTRLGNKSAEQYLAEFNTMGSVQQRRLLKELEANVAELQDDKGMKDIAEKRDQSYILLQLLEDRGERKKDFGTFLADTGDVVKGFGRGITEPFNVVGRSVQSLTTNATDPNSEAAIYGNAQADINQQLKDGKISEEEWVRRSNAIAGTLDAQTGGMEDRGFVDRLMRAAGTSVDVTSTIVPFLSGAKAFRAGSLAKEAVEQTGKQTLMKGFLRETGINVATGAAGALREGTDITPESVLNEAVGAGLIGTAFMGAGYGLGSAKRLWTERYAGRMDELLGDGMRLERELAEASADDVPALQRELDRVDDLVANEKQRFVDELKTVEPSAAPDAQPVRQDQPNTPRTTEELSRAQSDIAGRIVEAQQVGDMESLGRLRNELELLSREIDARLAMPETATSPVAQPAENISRAEADLDNLMEARDAAPETVTPEERAAGVRDKAYYDNRIAETQRYMYERAAAQSTAAPGQVDAEIAANDPVGSQPAVVMTSDGRTPEQLIEQARAQEPQYVGDIQAVAAATGGEVTPKAISNAVKTKTDRIAQKISQKGGRPPTDILRSTILSPDPAGQIDNIIRELQGRGYSVWVDPSTGTPDMTNRYIGGALNGYKDIAIKLTKGGDDPIVKELQIMTPEMAYAKSEGGGHKLYAEARTIENAAQLAELEAAMQQLYSDADAAAMRRLASSGEISTPSTMATAGANGSPDGSTVPLTLTPSDNNLTVSSPTAKNLSEGADGSIPLSIEPQADNVKLQERGFINTVRNSDNTAPEVVEGLANDPGYRRLTNEETLAAADEALAQDFEGVVQNAKNETKYSLATQAESLRAAEMLQEQGRFDDAVAVIEAMAARATEAGQASQILAAYNRLQPEGVVRAAQREIERAKAANPGRYAGLEMTAEQAQNLRQMAKELQTLTGDAKKQATRELLEEIERVVPTPGARKFTTLWKAGLLTGVKGAVGGNTVGNAAMAVLRKLSDVPAAGLDAALAKATGNRSKTFTLKGLLSGFGEGAKTGYKNFREGVGAENVGQKLDYKKTYYGKGKLGRAAQKYTDTVFNFYSASDRPFYHMALQNSLNDLAMVEAKNAGLSGRSAKVFAEGLVKEPPDEILSRAVADAENAVFQSKNALGAGLSGLKKGLSEKGGAAGEIVAETTLPFTGVPAGIAKAVYDYSPAGAVVDIYKALRARSSGTFDQAAQRQLVESLGKGITGTAVLWLGSQLVSDGIMTLGYPTDPDERALWEAEGKTPYSLLLGGKWRSLNYMGPITSLLSIGGQISADGDLASGLAASGKAILGSTPLKGVQGALDAVSDPARYGEGYIESLAGSTVPTLIKDIAVALDPTQREVEGPVDAVLGRIPLVRNSLDERLSIFGEEMSRPTSAVGSVIDPFKSSEAKNNPVTDELRRLFESGDKNGVNPSSKLDEKIKLSGVETELPKELRQAYQQRAGQAIAAAWAATIADPAYAALSDEDKAQALRNISTDIAAAEKKKLEAENNLGQYSPDFAGKASKLSAKQEAIANGQFTPANYLTGSVKVASSLSGPSRDIITKVEAMPPEEKKAFLREGQNEYNYELAKFENDSANGTLSAVDKYDKMLDLGKLKITTKYSSDARELYGLSETKINDFLSKNPTKQSVVDEMMAMDLELAERGFIKNRKFKDGIIGGSGSGGGSGGGRGKKVKDPPAPKFGSFRLVEPPKFGEGPDLSDVIADYQRNIGRIRVLDNLIAPESTSNIKISL